MSANETISEAGPTLKFGTVSNIDEKAVKARVRLDDFDNMRTGWLHVLQPNTLRDKDYCMPDIGEHVAVLLDAHGEDGLILGAIYSSADKPPGGNVNKRLVRFADDAVIEYDRSAHRLTVTGGIQEVLIETGATITLRAATKVVIDAPDTEVTGNLLVQKTLTYMQGMTGYSSGGYGASAVFNGSIQISGNLDVGGNAHVKGNATVDGSNSNHHSH